MSCFQVPIPAMEIVYLKKTGKLTLSRIFCSSWVWVSPLGLYLLKKFKIILSTSHLYFSSYKSSLRLETQKYLKEEQVS